MNVEYFIARRSATAKEGGKPSIMERVATLAVALSVAMMIISLAVVYGFKREVNFKLTGFSAEALLSNITALNNVDNEPITLTPELVDLLREQEALLAFAPYASREGVVRSDEAVEGISLRGVDSLFRWEFLSDALTEGELPRVNGESRTRDILLSQSLASRLGVECGDKLELIFSEETRALRRDLYKVCGIYSTGLEEWDRILMFTDIRNIQRLNNWSENEVSGLQLYYPSIEVARDEVEPLTDIIFDSEIEDHNVMIAITADQLYPALFDWLKTHDINALVIIVIMLIVAGFNMATALLIMVLERTRMIGVLKSLGMNNSSLRRVFLYRALRIIGVGLVWGNLFSIGAALIQQHFKLIKLDASGYMLQYVPIDLSLGWILLLNAAVVVAILAMMIIPTQMVSRVKIEKSLRYE